MIVSEPVQAEVFIPFSITLTFENQEEVNDLYNRAILSRDSVKEVSHSSGYKGVNLNAPFNSKLFDTLKRFV